MAVCLLGRVPFSPIDSSTVLRKVENDKNVAPLERAKLVELGGDCGPILAVELALKAMAEDNGGVELEEFVVSGKSRIMVLNIDRTRLVRELPESAQYQQLELQNQGQQNVVVPSSGCDVNNNGMFGIGGQMGRPMMNNDMWMPPMIPRGAPRVMGMMGMGRGMGMHRPPPMGANSPGGGPNAMMAHKVRTEEDDLKDLEALLNKKSFREMQKSKTGE